MQLARANGHLPRPLRAPPFVHTRECRRVQAPDAAPRTRKSSVDRTGLDDCSSMQCGSELGEDVLFDDSGQRR
jgi:hypothetical protein